MGSESNREETGVGRLACIGAGAMGEALVAGVLRAGLAPPGDVAMADVDGARLARVADALGVVAAADNGAAVAGADTVVVAVKPEFVGDALRSIGDALQPDALVISVAAGVPLAALERRLPPGAAVVRAMPNTPALVGAGATALALGRGAKPRHGETARRLFAAVGVVEIVPEALLDAVTGLSGSGPAYVYMFIEALADGGVHAGLPRDAALRLAAQTVAGAAKMVLRTGQHPGRLKDSVTSPAGTTIAGVAALEERGLRGACMQAVAAATARSRALGREREGGER